MDNERGPTRVKREHGAEQLSRMITGDLPVGRVVRPFILECGPDLPLIEAARRMSDAQCSSILVVDGEQTLGIWTERDALALDFEGGGAWECPVSAYMSSPVRMVPVDATLQDVAVRFRRDRVRHYLVVDDDGRRIGVVSQTDVILNQGVEHYLRLRKVRSALKREPLTVPPEAGLRAAADRMAREGGDAVVVVYGENDFGILTERDLVRLIARRETGRPVGELASRPLIAVEADNSLYSARNLLIESRVRHLGVTSENGQLVGLIGFRDILSGVEFAYVDELKNALRQRDEALVVSQRNLRLAEKVIESSLEGIIITNPAGVIESVNPAFTRLTGYSAEEAIGQTPRLLRSGRHGAEFYEAMWQQLAREGQWLGEIWNRRKNGEIYPELLTITAIRDDNGITSHYAALFSDISEVKENEERIRSLAYFDPLTGLPNRRLFYDRLTMAVAHAHRSGHRLAVMFVDLDRFKRVNDSLGHGIGDKLLQEVATRLVASVREDDTVARTGGDEFVIMLSEVDDVEGVVMIARRIIEMFTKPMMIEGNELVVTCSVGVSFYPDDADEAEFLIQNADSAMYRAKDLGRNSFQLYSPTMNARSLEHLAMETGLRRAIERNELILYYQPVVDTGSGKVIGAEALLRWLHPDMGMMPPADFIPLAEETGLIIPIGEWVIREAARQQLAWKHRFGVELDMAVNISALQFHEPDFLGRVRRILAEADVNPAALTFELTETLLMEDAVETIKTMHAIRRLGVTLSMDDFGTGYSSLSYLKRFPIDTLKIDRVFIRGIEHSRDDAAIVSAVINLAHSLRLKVVAEGVEKAAQLDYLRQTGCELVQGFHFSAPLPPEEFEQRFLAVEPQPSADVPIG